MIICISGSVGCGKTYIADFLGKKLGFEVLHLNEMVVDYSISSDLELETFDFDIDKFLDNFERKLKGFISSGKNIIIESHFAHFIDEKYIDFLFIINRDLKELKRVYLERSYPEKKIKDNLEVESFNLCYYEAEENGYSEDKIFLVENLGSLLEFENKIYKKISKLIDNFEK